MKSVVIERVEHDGINRVAIRFPYDSELIEVMRGIDGARWSKRLNCWHIPDSSDVVALLLKVFKDKAWVDYSKFSKTFAGRIKDLRDDKRKKTGARLKEKLAELSEKSRSDVREFTRWMEINRYPESTKRTYSGMVETFLRFVHPKAAGECESGDLSRLIEEYILPGDFSYAYQNQMISAVKKFYSSIYKGSFDIETLTRPRPQHRLPNVLSKEEVRKILDSTINEKHRVMLSLIYACGLRRSELINLKSGDIDRSRMLLIIRQSKGNKDRVIPISDKVLSFLESYIVIYKPVNHLFEGAYQGSKYSASSLDKVFRMSCTRAGIKKQITLHGLRHSYATHLLESGTDIRYIQVLLGHKSSKTTEIYTHVTASSIQKIKSPFDDL